ncbi:phosphatase PAP2 family protein [Litorivivens sp.]|uniref:phosphatase PAP2 family protein n=1 Tax=Litorivivens sp. TaxID=2020868 RepID=UPI00356A3406
MAEELSWGAEIILWLQQFHSPLFALPMQALGWLGTSGYLLLLPAVVFCIQQRLGMRLAIVFGLSLFLNSLLGNLFDTTRPAAQFPQITGASSGYSFPSGHAQLAVVYWGMLATHFRHWLGWVIAVVMIVASALATLYLGANYPLDILSGWLLGGAIVYGVWRWEPQLEEYLVAHGKLMQLACTLAATTLMWAFAGFFLHDVLITGSIGFFMGCCLVGILHPPGLDHLISWPVRIARLLLGLLLMLLMIASLQRAAAWLDWSSTLTSLGAMAVLGGWMAGGVPTILDFLAAWLHNRSSKSLDH